MAQKQDPIAQVLQDTLISPNEADSNWEPANVVDGLFAVARAIHRLAEALEQQQNRGSNLE